MPACVAIIISTIAFAPRERAEVPLEHCLIGLGLHSGAAARSLMRSSAKANCTCTGCSDHSDAVVVEHRDALGNGDEVGLPP